MIAVNTQTLIFFRSLWLGALLGMMYDLFRIFRIAVPTPNFAAVAEDILFFLLSAFLSFGFILSVNYGQVRFFILLGEGLGFLLYYLTVGPVVMKSVKKIISAAKKVLLFLWKITLGPILRLLLFLGKKLWKRVGKRLKKSKKVVEMHRKHLHIRWVLLYNYFKNRAVISKNKSRAKQREKNNAAAAGGRVLWKRKRTLPKADC